MTFTVGFVTGATPDKWARIWRERSRERIELVPVTEEDQERLLRDGEVDMCLVRLPVDRDHLHCIPLYEEQPVVVMGKEHLLSLLDEVSFEDLAEEQLVLPERGGWTPATEQLAWPPMNEKDAIETVAAGTGVVIVPMSIARLYHRKDTVSRPLTDAAPTQVGLAWLLDNDSERTQDFIGIVRGRSRNSSRG